MKDTECEPVVASTDPLFAQAKTVSERLRANPFLMVDTQWFSTEFKYRLLAQLHDIDAQCDGLLVHSENFQALNLFQYRYGAEVDCIYIDPPYNTGNDGFAYKDSFWHSSWASMIWDRVNLARPLLKKAGSLFAQIDDYEEHNLRHILDSVMTAERRINRIAWVRTFNSGSSKGLSKKLPANLDTIFWYSKTGDYTHKKILREYSDGAKKRYDKVDEQGRRFKWNPMKTYSKDKLERLLKSGDAMWTADSKYPVYRKFLNEDSGAPLDNNWHDIAPIGTFASERVGFETQKPVKLIERCITLTDAKLILDFFAGSGTTAHAAINSNRANPGSVKYIATEIGAHFASLIKPRLQRMVYADEWSDKMPQNSDTGLSHCFKYLRLESYEDTLNNLALKRPDGLTDLFDPAGKEDYLLHYMLNVESQASLLSVEDFKKPFDYKLRIATDSAGACQTRAVDLVETFNYLLGLRVAHLDAKLDLGYVLVSGKLSDGQSCLIIWRDCDKLGYEATAKLLDRHKITPTDNEYDVVYINGDHNIPTIAQATEAEGGVTRQLTLRQIEPEFIARMFSGEEA